MKLIYIYTRYQNSEKNSICIQVHLNVVTKSCTLILYFKTRKVQPKKYGFKILKLIWS